MSENNCWPREKLKEYLAGWADENQTQQIEAHLSNCTLCEETIVALEKEPDTLVGIVSSLKQESPENESSKLAALLAKAGDLVHADERADEQANDPSDDSGSRLPAPTKIGPYFLQRSLGRGGMGSVFLARHQQLGKLVAIKLLPWRSTHREHFEARFQREVRAAGGLDHPSIVSATDAGEENGTHYLVMEFIDGLDLSRLVRALGQVQLADACELIRHVALGLSHAHAEGIVHRDIKPSNLMLNRRGQVKILDFGLARLGPWNEESAELTTVGQLMGTLDYMAPEQAERAESVDYRADLYSLGATLFRLLCGRAPLAASPDQSPLAKLRLLATEEPPKLSTLRPDAPLELTQLVAEMLARDPSDRPASAAHVAERLEPFCHSHDLGSLLRTALEKVELLQTTTNSPSKAVGDVGNQVGAGRPSSTPLNTAEANAKSSRSSGTHWGWIGIACAAMAGLIYCGITIWIDSQSGWLHIDSDAKVSIEIASDSAPVKHWKIEPGANTTKLYAGKYRIVLEEGSDGVQLDQQQLLVTKGGVTIAKVYKDGKSTESPNSMYSQPSLGLPRIAIPPASTAILIPGDALMVSSQTDEKFSHRFVIQADSTAKLPMIGTINVAGLTVDTLEQQLKDRYSKYFRVSDLEVFRDPIQSTVATSDFRQVASDTRSTSNPMALENVPEPADAAAPIYKGRPLSEWLKLIALEKSLEGFTEALQALDASISDETRSRIVAQLKKDLPQLRWHDVYSTLSRDYLAQGLSNPYPFAFSVLRKAGATQYFEYVRSELQSTKDDQWKMVVLRHAIPEGATAQELEPVKAWLNAQLSQGAASPYFEDSVSCLLRRILSPASTDEDRRVWISMLEGCPHLSSLFWLELPFHDYHGFESRMPKGSAGRLARVFAVGSIPESEVCWRTLIDHAIRVLVKSTNAPDELSKSGYAIVCSTAILMWSPVKPSADQVQKLEAISKSWYAKMVESEVLREIQVEVPFEVARRFQPNLGSGTYWLPLQFALVSSLAKYSEPPESLIKTLLPGAARAIYAIQKLDPWASRRVNIVSFLTSGFGAIQLVDKASEFGTSSQVKLDAETADTFDLCSLSVLNVDKQQLANRLLEPLKRIYASTQLALLDKDKDGKVNLEESHDGLLKIVAYSTEGKSTEDDAKRVAEQVDTNKDKAISVDEYVAYRDAWESKSNGATAADIEWAKKQISKYDKDNDGKLSNDEQSKMLATPKGADINNDGYIDALEYAAYRAR